MISKKGSEMKTIKACRKEENRRKAKHIKAER